MASLPAQMSVPDPKRLGTVVGITWELLAYDTFWTMTYINRRRTLIGTCTVLY